MSSIDYAYSRFCTERFPLPTEQQIADLERRINVTFPMDYREFLQQYNGGYFCEPTIQAQGVPRDYDGLTFMHGIGASHPTSELGDPYELSLWDDNDPPIMVPIGYTQRGNFVVIFIVVGDEDYGGIGLVTPETTYDLGDTLEEFFSCLQPVNSEDD